MEVTAAGLKPLKFLSFLILGTGTIAGCFHILQSVCNLIDCLKKNWSAYDFSLPHVEHSLVSILVTLIYLTNKVWA